MWGPPLVGFGRFWLYNGRGLLWRAWDYGLTGKFGN